MYFVLEVVGGPECLAQGAFSALSRHDDELGVQLDDGGIIGGVGRWTERNGAAMNDELAALVHEGFNAVEIAGGAEPGKLHGPFCRTKFG